MGQADGNVDQQQAEELGLALAIPGLTETVAIVPNCRLALVRCDLINTPDPIDQPVGTTSGIHVDCF